MEGRDEAFGHEIEYFAGWNHDASFRVRAESEGFWRRLCPDLSITDRPFDRAGAPYTFPPDVVARAAACMRR